MPPLKYVATSSVGGSVGPFVADLTMTQQQLTRAFLASRQFEAESLGARWVEAQHTGVWRKSCREIVRFLNEQQYVAAGSAGPTPAHGSAADHSDVYDRNLFLCAACTCHPPFLLCLTTAPLAGT